MSNENPFGGPGPSGDDDDFDVDLGEASVSQYRIPPDTYKLKCIDVTKDVSKQGNPMWVWDFAVAEGEYSGKELRVYTALTPSAMWKLDQVVQALKLPVVDGRAKFSKKDPKTTPIGRIVEADVVDNEYNGRTNSAVDELRPLD